MLPAKEYIYRKIFDKRKGRPTLCGGSRDRVRPATKLVKQADGKGASAAQVPTQCPSQGLEQPGGGWHGAGRPRRGRHDHPVARLGCSFIFGVTEGAKIAPSHVANLFVF